MNKALFLDRDGVINVDTGYVGKIEAFVFTDGIFGLVQLAIQKGYLPIIVTNQAGIARGYYSEDDYQHLNEWMLTEFARCDASISAVYHCPYHPVNGIGEYKRESPDRKPNPGMLLRASEDFDIDFSASALIGDKDSDIEAGRRAGVGKLIQLRGRYPVEPSIDVIVIDTLKKAVKFL